VDAPLRGDPKARNRVTYDNVINQFAVEENPRYKPRRNGPYYTYCNIFVWDVTRAMGAMVPHWVGEDGKPIDPWPTDQGWVLSDPSRWMGANDTIGWLDEHGPQYGWREVSAEEAQDLANLGHPTVASVYEPHDAGHIGIVRPGEMLNGPALAQAGTYNFNHAYVYNCFPAEGTQFFVNDAGTVVELEIPPQVSDTESSSDSHAVQLGAALGAIVRRISTSTVRKKR
jgi:hypothetical protein